MWIERLPQQVGLLVTWAVLLGLSFPRANLWLLAYVALVPLTLVGVRGRPAGRVAGLTYGIALAWWLVMIAWMIPVTLPGYLVLSAYMAVYPLAFVLLMRLIHQRLDWPFTFTVPVVWVGLEYVRGLVMTGFPWFLLGQSQPTLVIQIADVVGAYGVSFFVGVFNGLIADLMTRPLVRPALSRRQGARGWGGPLRGPLFATSLMLVMTLTYGSYRVVQTDRLEQVGGQADSSLRVAVVQTDVPQDNKVAPTDEQDIANFQTMLDLSEQALDSDPPPDLLVWPETMVPRAINDEAVEVWNEQGTFYADYRERIEQFADDHDVTMVVGAHAMRNWERVQRGDYAYLAPLDRYNAAYFVEPGRGVERRYDKLHRVPFGEYMPWVEHWPFLQSLVLKLTPHERDYSLTPGERYTWFELGGGGAAQGAAAGGGWRLATPICFEDVVSYVPRKMTWNGAKMVDLLVNLTNDGWFAGTAEAPQHEQIARFRTVENRVPMARAVNRGVSGFIDSAGRIRGRVVTDGETQEVTGTATMDFYKDHRVTLFSQVGDVFAGVCLAATLGLVGFAGFGRLRGFVMGWRNRKGAASATALLAMAILLGGGVSGAAAQSAERIEGPPDELIGPEPLKRIDPTPPENPATRQPAPPSDGDPGEPRIPDQPDEPEPEKIERTLPQEPVDDLREMDEAALNQYTLKLLVKASMSEDAALRSNAIEALQQRPRRALPVVHGALEDDNPAVRYAAAVTAGLLEFEDVVPAIEPLLEDDHPAVRAAALSALHVLGERVNLTPLADMLRSRDPGLRGNVALLLGLMGDTSAIPMLKLAAVEPMPRASAGEIAVARIQIAEAIARLDGESGVDSLRGGAYSQFDEVRVIAIIALGAVEDQRMEVGFEQMLEDPPMEIQLAAAGTLARLGNESGRSITQELSEHENPVIRAQAAWVLGWYEDRETARTLLRLLADESQQVQVAAAASVLRRLPAQSSQSSSSESDAQDD